MSTPEFSYPITPPNPSPPSSNPTPPSPSSPNPPSPPSSTDPCVALQQAAGENVQIQCENLHFGTPRCTIDWAYFNNAPCGFGPKPYQNGIGFAGTYFRPFDDKGFFRIEGVADSAAGEANLYSYVGSTRIFEAYMYKDGLNIKGKQGGQLGSIEDCHIKIYKGANQTEIDYQGNTINGEYGAEIFKSDIYKQTAELFIQKYDYNQEWVGFEANISKSIVWGGRDQSNFYRLMYDYTSPSRGFLEIIKNGYTTYHQIKVEDQDINHYSQYQSSNFYKKFVIDSTHAEDTLYFGGGTVKALVDNNESSTYNAYAPDRYATTVSKVNEAFCYLVSQGGAYSFIESKAGDGRAFGVRDGGGAYWDLNTTNDVYFQIADGDYRLYVAPVDIGTNSAPEDTYASFKQLKYNDALGVQVIAAFISSKDVDLTHLGTCWAKYACAQAEVGTLCYTDLIFGGPTNNKCKLSAFDVYTGPVPQFEIYQYQYGIDLKSFEADDGVKIYVDHASTAQLDNRGGTQAGINAKRADNNIRSYLLVDASYGYQNIEYQGGMTHRNVAGSSTADTTIYDSAGDRQVYLGVNSSQGAISYRFTSDKLAFGYAKSSDIDFRLSFQSSSKAFLNSASSEAKVQVDKGSNYGQIFSDSSKTRMTLYGNNGFVEGTAKSDEGKIQVSRGGNYGYLQAGIEDVSCYAVKSSNFAFLESKTTESKVQVSRGGNYGYIAATSSNVDMELLKGSSYAKGEATNTEGKFQVSFGGTYVFMNAKSDKASIYMQKGGATISIDTSEADNKMIKLREVDICEGGETKKIIILASEPF